MQHGHVTGHKKEKPGSQDWYAAIAEETLRQLEAEEATQRASAQEDD